MQLNEPDLNVYSYSISHFQSSLKVEKLKGGGGGGVNELNKKVFLPSPFTDTVLPGYNVSTSSQ